MFYGNDTKIKQTECHIEAKRLPRSAQKLSEKVTERTVKGR